MLKKFVIWGHSNNMFLPLFLPLLSHMLFYFFNKIFKDLPIGMKLWNEESLK